MRRRSRGAGSRRSNTSPPMFDVRCSMSPSGPARDRSTIPAQKAQGGQARQNKGSRLGNAEFVFPRIFGVNLSFDRRGHHSVFIGPGHPIVPPSRNRLNGVGGDPIQAAHGEERSGIRSLVRRSPHRASQRSHRQRKSGRWFRVRSPYAMALGSHMEISTTRNSPKDPFDNRRWKGAKRRHAHPHGTERQNRRDNHKPAPQTDHHLRCLTDRVRLHVKSRWKW